MSQNEPPLEEVLKGAQSVVDEVEESPDDALAKPVPNPAPSASDDSAEPAHGPAEGERQVPVSAIQAERQRRQEAEDRARRLEAEMAQVQAERRAYAESQQQPQSRYDPYAEAIQSLHAQQVNNALEMSRILAREKHGADTVKQAEDAFVQAARTDPGLAQRVQGSSHPLGVVMEWYKKQQVLSEVGDDPTAYREKLRQEIIAEMQGQGVNVPSAQARPNNLAGSRSTGPAPGALDDVPTDLGSILKRAHGES